MKKILVVDDNEDITDLVETILQAEGYSCTVANNGQECLALLKNNRYDLVLMDIAMPEITGLDVIDKLKSEGTFSQHKVVLFTASSMTDSDMKELTKTGALECIRKPFSKGDLMSLISKYAS
jgi:two-component system OmpR family response regulator